MTATEPTPLVKNLNSPDDRRVMGTAGVHEIVEVGAASIVRATHEPGWRWSTHIKPSVGTEWCQGTHVGYVISGHERVKMQDGSEFELGPGDAFRVPAGHDAWTVGNEPVVSIDFSGKAE